MRVAVLLLACACAAAPPAPLANVETWARGRLVHVAVLRCLEDHGSFARVTPCYPDDARKVFEDELSSVGFRVSDKPADGTLEATFTQSGRGILSARFDAGETHLGEFSANLTDSPCMSSNWGSHQAENYRCMSREVLRQATSSPAFTARIQAHVPP